MEEVVGQRHASDSCQWGGDESGGCPFGQCDDECSIADGQWDADCLGDGVPGVSGSDVDGALGALECDDGGGESESDGDDGCDEVEADGAFSGEDAHACECHADGHDAPEGGDEEGGRDEGHED